MNKLKEDKLKLIAIKTKNKVYISDNIRNDSYFYSELGRLLFDGKKPKNTYDKSWFELDSIPTKIEREKPKEKINKRYELKSGFPESELTPRVIKYEDFDELYDDVRGLYEFKYEETEAGLEDVEFEINIIEEVDGNFEMKRLEYEPVYNFLDKITTHPKLLPLKPCKLTKEQSYKIIREHIKNNIDPKYAVITSDYDFCFTVEKKIELYEPRKYTVDINLFNKRRKPKYETRYQRSRTIKIFEIAPKPYQNYPVVQEFEGDNYEDLLKNIDKYLNELMEIINKPLKECEYCKGTGVILDDNN